MERREIKKIPIDEAMQILHNSGIHVSQEETEKILDFLSLLTQLILSECFDDEWIICKLLVSSNLRISSKLYQWKEQIYTSEFLPMSKPTKDILKEIRKND